MKECGKCADAGRPALKDESEFYKRSLSEDGLQLICKSCSKLNSELQGKKAKRLRAVKKAARIELKKKIVNSAGLITADGAKSAAPDA
jgi:uncharacterized protein with von Willebrand factor type A (vWA) domain